MPGQRLLLLKQALPFREAPTCNPLAEILLARQFPPSDLGVLNRAVQRFTGEGIIVFKLLQETWSQTYNTIFFEREAS